MYTDATNRLYFSINERAVAIIQNQIKQILRVWYIYLPIVIVLDLIAFARRANITDNLLREVVVALFTMGTIFIFGFIIMPLRRLSVINHIVVDLELAEKGFYLTTYQVLWKASKKIWIHYGEFELIDHANDKGVELYGEKPSYRLKDKETGKIYFFAAPFFDSWNELYTNLIESTP